MDLVALVHVVAATQPGPAHAAAFEGVCERSLDELTAPSHRCLAHRGAKAIAVGVDCLAGILVAVPAQKFLALRFGDACLPHSAIQFFQDAAGVIAFVGNAFGGTIFRRRLSNEGQILLRRLSVPGNVPVSPFSAVWISAATMAPVSRSTACSGL